MAAQTSLVVIPPEELRAMLREVVREELDARASEATRLISGMQRATGTLSVAEAAQHAHRHPETIRRAIHDSTLKAAKPQGGREWLIEPQELQRWMKAQRPKHQLRASDLKSEVDSAVARALGAG